MRRLLAVAGIVVLVSAAAGAYFLLFLGYP